MEFNGRKWVFFFLFRRGVDWECIRLKIVKGKKESAISIRLIF